MAKDISLSIKIGGKIDRSLQNSINAAQSNINRLASGVNKAMTAVTVATVAAGAKIVKDSVTTYMDYQSALNSAAAVGGVERGTAAYEALNAAAREAGRTTVKTASESANALEYMMLAGWSVEDSTKALMPVLKLSASTGAELATTSDLVTDSMSNMGIGIDGLNHYLDVAAAANNKTNQSATQLQEAYLGVGGVLKNLNVPLEESAAILGVLANRGTKGSEAGTGLNAILINMQKRSGDAYKAMSKLGVSMYDSEGKTRDILEVFDEINKKTASMTEENRNLMYQMIGGKNHLASFSKIMQGFNTTSADGTKEVYSLAKAFENCDGALDQLYGIKMDTLEGSVLTLKSAFDDMKISVGERVAPTLQNAAQHLAEQMPQIGDTIVGVIDKIVPAATRGIDYISSHADELINKLLKFVKIFVGLKIGGGVINGINGVATLGRSLKALTAAKGGVGVLKSVTGTLAGIKGKAAFGSAAKGLTSTASAAGAAIAPIAGAAGMATAVLGTFYGISKVAQKIQKIKFEKQFLYAKDLPETTQKIQNATESLQKYNDISSEISDLRLIIQTPTSTTEQVQNAQDRLNEIAEMLGAEYNLTINADTKQLEQAAELAQTVTRSELYDANNKAVPEILAGAEQYKKDVANQTAATNKQNELGSALQNYQTIVAAANAARNLFAQNAYTEDEYLAKMTELYTQAKKFGYSGNYANESVDDFGNVTYDVTNTDAAYRFTQNLGGVAVPDMQNQYNAASAEVNRINQQIGNLEQSTQSAQAGLLSLLQSDVQNGNFSFVNTDIVQLENLGGAMRAAGMDTDALSVSVAAAKAGFADFSSAVSAGKTDEMAQTFYDFQTSIGVSADQAAMGAALIQNGFATAQEAIDAGDGAINDVIQDLITIGSMNGVFDGLTAPEDIIGKINELAQAVGLIPNDEKEITVDGIFEGENKIQTALEFQEKLKDKTVTYTIKTKQEGFIGGIPIGFGSNTDGSHAGGLERVPFDGYIAELHKDERVLTAEEAAAYNNGGWLDSLIEALYNLRNGGQSPTFAGAGGGSTQITFSPNINISGGADEKKVISAVRLSFKEFKKLMDEYESDKRRKSF